MRRGAGVLMHISSLPSPYGIGTLGRATWEFADFAARSGFQYWQLLPVGPTSIGDSPYQSFSTFAGNPYFIDLDILIQEGLLFPGDVALDWGEGRRVDYGKLYQNRFRVLKLAFERGYARDGAAVARFRRDNAQWLEDYALFMALKAAHGMEPWTAWEEGARKRRPEALARYRRVLKDDIDFYAYIQYLFFKQWEAFRAYVKDKGIKLIGDVPIYVSPDSADVWAEPGQFLLDGELRPKAVAGVPPDYFCAEGQLWGNPLYNWKRMGRDGYRWWIKRLRAAARRFDTVRIDHFRGLSSYWSVPYGQPTAEHGEWLPGPGMGFVRAIRRGVPGLAVIAEDLGMLTPDVYQLMEASGYPGMKVLEFAFDLSPSNPYLPHAYDKNCVCYTGTHDNDTLLGWWESRNTEERRFITEYFGLNPQEGELNGLIRGGMSSPASLFIAQMQDYLGLGPDCRMNTPATAFGNWQWRMLPGEACDGLAEHICRIIHRYGR